MTVAGMVQGRLRRQTLWSEKSIDGPVGGKFYCSRGGAGGGSSKAAAGWDPLGSAASVQC